MTAVPELTSGSNEQAACVMSGNANASVMPSLDAFDEEFGQDQPDTASAAPQLKRGLRLSSLLGVALAAGLITAAALAWPKLAADSEDSAYEKPEATIERLTRELETLRQENRELAEAQQHAAETIGSLQAAQQEQPTPTASWYSDAGALTYRISTQSEASTNPSRSAAARPRPREVPRHDTAGPISLDPQ